MYLLCSKIASSKIKGSIRKNVNELNRPLLHRISQNIQDGQRQSLAQLLLLVNLSPPLMDHRPPDPSHMQSCPQFCCSGSFLSVHNPLPSLLEHSRVAINELKNGYPLHLDKIKLCWHVLIQLTTFPFQTQMTF